MAVPTNTVQTFAMVGIREDLSDVITNISPTQTPFYSACKKGTCKNRTPEWEKDGLANGDPTNAVIEGDDVGADAGSQPTRLRNVVQLFDKVVSVSSTAQSVDSAGKSDELKYQVAKKGKELKRDIEMRIAGNYASVLGAAGTAGQCGGIESWLATNVSRGGSGASGGYSSGLTVAATDGTLRAWTEAMLKSVIASCWNAGGEPNVIMVNGTKKQKASSFAGIATQYRENSGVKQATILGAADVYVSDFGEFRIVPNRFLGAGTGRTPTNGLYPGASALILDFSTLAIKALQPMAVENLAKTGHSDKKLMYTELTLAVSDEAANGVVADLNDS